MKMKKLIKNLAVKIIKWLFKGDLKGQLLNDLKEISKEVYQTNIRLDFEVHREIVPVKKGKIKYRVAYFHVNNGKKLRIVLKRNDEDIEYKRDI